MTKEFLPYDRALKLKQLGFDEPCFGYYKKTSLGNDSQNLVIQQTEIGFYNVILIPEHTRILAPLFQQAFKWFRENYSLYSLIGMHPNTKEWYSSYQNLNWSGKETLDFIKTEDRSIRFKTYEEAELACLDKLIEIVELKQQEQ
jgi:hypothetical protein